MTAVEDRIRIKRIAFATYAHTDLAYTHRFLTDFGLIKVAESNGRHYYRGYGDLPYIYIAEQARGNEPLFKGMAFEVESEAELIRASKHEGASPIYDLEGPGGGRGTTLYDPNGLAVHLVYGMEMRVSDPPEDATLPANRGILNTREKARPAGQFQRFNAAADPVPVHKLGHYVLFVPDFQRIYDFYTKTLTFAASDLMIGENGKPMGSFLHLDRGDEWVDHHTLFIYSPPGLSEPKLHHAAFEVFDIDHELRGHENLLKKGYELSWGVGRHILGSQLFDYWYQSGDGFKVEHYADGDLVNQHTPVGKHAVSPGPPSERDTSIWGPDFQPTIHTTSSLELKVQ